MNRKHSIANIKKARDAWQISRERENAQPEGRFPLKQGTAGEEDYYQIEVRPKEQFALFRTREVGKKGGIQRVSGQRRSGSWDDQKWLIGKDEAHRRGDTLVPDSETARDVFEKLGSEPMHLDGARFRAEPGDDTGVGEKTVLLHKKAQHRNRKVHVGKTSLGKRS